MLSSMVGNWSPQDMQLLFSRHRIEEACAGLSGTGGGIGFGRRLLPSPSLGQTLPLRLLSPRPVPPSLLNPTPESLTTGWWQHHWLLSWWTFPVLRPSTDAVGFLMVPEYPMAHIPAPMVQAYCWCWAQQNWALHLGLMHVGMEPLQTFI